MRAEDQIQSAIVAYVRAVAPRVIVYAIPNASRRTQSGRASNAVPGLLPGMPDLGLAIPDGRCAFIEVKTPKGKLSNNQKVILARMDCFSIPYIVATGIDEVRVFLRFLGVATREAATK